MTMPEDLAATVADLPTADYAALGALWLTLRNVSESPAVLNALAVARYPLTDTELAECIEAGEQPWATDEATVAEIRRDVRALMELAAQCWGAEA